MNNGQAIGYMILACKALDLSRETIKQIETEMVYQMDMETEERAEKEYQNF